MKYKILPIFFIINLFSLKVTAQISRETSIANYQIEVSLDTRKKLIEGSEIVSWFNNSNDQISELRFHLYHNAYKSEKSSYCSEGNISIKPNEKGYTEILFIKILNSDYPTPQTYFIQPDDPNPFDQTVLVVKLAKPLKPKQGIKLNIGFITKLPPGGIGRSCYAKGREFYFVSQWFPKIGVYEEGKGWNCHQFHRNSEFFSDFGLYEVRITIPKYYTIGATGRRESEIDNGSTVTYTYRQENIHDFAWTASPDFIEVHELFRYQNLPETNIILLIQPEHKDQIERHMAAIKAGLKYLGETFGPYPYSNITVVDPPMTSSSGAMEYPMLISTGTNYLLKEKERVPETLILHELVHQYWYGIVAGNETEEAWLDEGLTTYTAGEILEAVYKTNYGYFRIGGGVPIQGLPIITYDEFPLVAYMGEMEVSPAAKSKNYYLQKPFIDQIYKHHWKYLDRTTYRIGSYYKPDLMLRTLENFLGKDVMQKILKEYYTNFRFSHPKTKDFIETVERVSKKDMDWFFTQILYNSDILDYAVLDVKNTKTDYKNRIEIVLSRQGTVRFPTEIEIFLEDGSTIHDFWDGNEQWVKLVYYSDSPAIAATVDPNNKILLDVNTANNSRLVDINIGPVLKWAAQWLFWMQSFFSIISSIC